MTNPDLEHFESLRHEENLEAEETSKVEEQNSESKADARSIRTRKLPVRFSDYVVEFG